MITELEKYYKKKGILSTHFSCPYKKICKGDNDKFYGPKSAFISSGYEEGKIPRLLILSLDPGNSEKNKLKRLPTAVRKTEEERDILAIHKGRHWYRTHEIAFYILRHFVKDLSIETVKHYFAHVNSVKCSMNNPQNKQASKVLFNNCRGYLFNELFILVPDIIVTQGLESKKAIVELIPKNQLKAYKNNYIITLNGRKIFWLHTVHPSNYGAFHKQYDKGKGWEKCSKKIYKWYLENL
ncbi:MAG: hypothetical protein WC557_05720 [Ignavibacteriaceae bacterium]